MQVTKYGRGLTIIVTQGMAVDGNRLYLFIADLLPVQISSLMYIVVDEINYKPNDPFACKLEPNS